MSFIGHFPAKLDSKNRVFLPSAYRHQLQLDAAESANSKTGAKAKAGATTVIERVQSVIEGSQSVIEGSQSVIEGSQSVIEGSQSVIEGSQSVIEGSQSVIEGSQSATKDPQPVKNDSHSVAEGLQSAVQELTLVIRKDYFENCLVIYPMEQWQAEVAKVRSKLNRFDSTQQMVYRKLVSEAMEVTLDANGRMLIPRALLEKAGIGQEVLFVGMEQTIELWAAEKAQATGAGGEAFMSENEFADQIMAFMKE